MYPRLFKRLLDVTGALVGLILLSPVLFIISLLIRFRMGSPILFRQQRPGLHGKLFTMLKFRTMTDQKDTFGNLLPDADRLVPLGKFLRRTSLDELPELINVLRGEMSLVGPRPLLIRYLPYFTEREAVRHTIKPGITGWAQINGRNTASWNQRLADDVWYVENRRLGLDIRILALTVWKVIHNTGVVVDANSIMRDLDDERQNGVTKG